MGGYKIPNIGLAEESSWNDEGTMCVSRSAPPGPTDALSSTRGDDLKLRTELRVLYSEVTIFASRFIKDSAARMEYLTRAQAFRQNLLAAVSEGRMTPGEAARRANRMRNALLEVSRLKSSDIGRAIAESLKATGMTLVEAQEKYALKRFGKAFGQLLEGQKGEVYMDIVKASGRPRPSVTKAALRWGKIGKGLLVLSIGLVVYDVYTAEDKGKALATGAASIGGGFAGGAGGGFLAGLWCGPGAPVCSTVGVLVGGGLGALGFGSLVDWLWD